VSPAAHMLAVLLCAEEARILIVQDLARVQRGRVTASGKTKGYVRRHMESLLRYRELVAWFGRESDGKRSCSSVATCVLLLQFCGSI
jgi:hypothetical protein